MIQLCLPLFVCLSRQHINKSIIPSHKVSEHLKSRFGKPTSWWLTVYTGIQFTTAVYLSLELDKLKAPYFVSLLVIFYLILYFTNIGLLFDLK